MSAKVDLRGFFKSVSLMSQLPRKYGPDVLNKSIVKVAIGSGGEKGIVQLTKKATVARIRNDLNQDGKLKKLAAEWLSKNNKPINKSSLNAAMEQILSARIKSRGYIAASWLFAALPIVRVTPGLKLSRLNARGANRWSGGTAKDSFGQAANPNRLRGGLFSTARGANLISSNAVIQMAVDGATADNTKYLRRKFGAALSDAIRGTNTAKNIQE